ncbi:MAG: fatty acid oxidation complex subunit alpha FadJ [Sandaracinaceae bacterium]
MTTEIADRQRGALSVERRPDGVAVLWFDVPGESVNTLRDDFTEDFRAAFDELEGDADIRGVVFASRKRDFVVGADVKVLQTVESARQAADLARAGQRAMDRIASFRVPVVAAIHGACLGGGLEIALACHGRVASSDPRTKLGQPEGKLGLIPGAGGTQRLPRLIDVASALDLLLTGREVPAKRALRLGLVDEVVPEAILVDVAADHARRLAATDHRSPASSGPSRLLDAKALREAALTETAIGRKILFDQARKNLLKKTRGNYPAQERTLEVVQEGLAQGFARGLEAEAEAFGDLVVSPQAESLIGIFRATTAMKRSTGVDDASVEPRTIDRVGVLGAGLMGAGIAYVTTALAGLPVRLKDRDEAGIAAGLRTVRRILDGRVKRRRLTPRERDVLVNRVTGTTDYLGFERTPIVIEAVFEDLALKHRVLRDVEDAGPEEVIFASNTSSIPIGRIAEASRHPETVVGMHYFSPVEKMPLLEIIRTDRTADWVVATAVELGKRQGKTVIVVNDGVGFYTSRILGPLMNEAAFLLQEGTAIERIDGALMDWGFPVGPITLLDEVGIDVAEKVGHVVVEAFGERMRAPAGFEKLIADGRHGRKNGRGFYRYENGKKAGRGKKAVDPTVYAVLGVEPTGSVEAEDIAQRCALAFVNEAARCFGEGILRSARDGDIGAVFGLGFPPFRGGPFRYVDTVGAKEIVRRLDRYRDRHGDRFAAAPVLRALAESGRTFHGDARMEPGQHREGVPARAAVATPAT